MFPQLQASSHKNKFKRWKFINIFFTFGLRKPPISFFFYSPLQTSISYNVGYQLAVSCYGSLLQILVSVSTEAVSGKISLKSAVENLLKRCV